MDKSVLTVEPDTSHAPGCYGSALMCKPDTAECGSCAFVGSCAPLSATKREALHTKFGVKVKAPKVKKPKVEKPSTAIVSTEAKALVDRIEASGLAVASSLKAGTNPFAKPAFLRIACHLLMKVPHGITRDQLAVAFMSKLGWEKPRALAQAVIAIEALTALGATSFTDGRLASRT